MTASFEGQPADNAAHFVTWLENDQDHPAFSDIKFAVFGCGNRDWVNTYQRIPKLIDEQLASHGAKRLVERGEGDAAGSEFFESFDTWEKGLWEKLAAVSLVCCVFTGLFTWRLQEFGTTGAAQPIGIDVKTVVAGTTRAEVLRQKDIALGTVAENRVLTSPNAPTKRHIGMF